MALVFRAVGTCPAMVRRHRWWLAVAGIGLGGYQALYFVGVQEVGVTVSTLVSLGIAPVALAGWAAARAAGGRTGSRCSPSPRRSPGWCWSR